MVILCDKSGNICYNMICNISSFVCFSILH